ncbi:MAG: DHH family phosphoesterase [Candidatus Micrarchaeota archaeon]|nr:DHH family phosphoesterase [Candidatus Micrarchaeota archaeon]
MGNEQAFFSRCSEAFDAIAKMQNPLIVHHYDCDGITSGAIVASWFESAKKPYRMLTVKRIDQQTIISLKHEKDIIFVDLGSSSPSVEELSKSNVVIIDHHQPQTKEHLQANPHLFGFDGGSHASASACAYFVFRRMPDLGITGAVGDIQYPLQSLNRIMLLEAQKAGEVQVKKDLRLFGKSSRPLIQFLAYADDPYLPGLTGNDEAAAFFLSQLGISLKDEKGWRTYYSLTQEEKKRLVSALAQLVSERISAELAEKLVGEVYLFLSRPQNTELFDASDFSTLVNACGRNGRYQLGVDVCLGKEGAYEEARALLAIHRKHLKDGLAFAQQNLQDFGKFFFLDGRGVISDTIIGVVIGMLFPAGKPKPIIGIALEEEGNIKISARASKSHVERGLNLGLALSGASEAVGGIGGGHNIAAGASIPPSALNDFLKELGERL